MKGDACFRRSNLNCDRVQGVVGIGYIDAEAALPLEQAVGGVFDCDQIVSRMVTQYSVLLGEIDLQRQGGGVLYPLPACNMLCCNELS